MKISSLNNPLAIIRPLERDGAESEIESLRRHHRGLAFVPMTPQIVDEFCKSLMKGMFLFVGSDSEEYKKCFQACVAWCKVTGAFKATSWNSWDGLDKLMDRIEQVERLTRRTRMLHCSSAPVLIVAIAMFQVILRGRISGRDKVSDFLREFDCNNKAATAIHYFEMDYRQHILTLDQLWDMNASIQHPRPQSMEQSKPTTSDGGMLMPRNNSSREAMMLDEERVSVKVEPPVAYQAAPPVAHQTAPPVASQAIPPALYQTAPHNITHQVADLREERHEEPMSISIPTPESSLVRETHKQVIRADIMQHLQPLLNRLKSEDWNGVIQRDIMQVLTDKNIKVLTASAKNLLGIWATRSKNDMLLSWLEQARDDVVAFQWTERYVEPAPSTWLLSGQSAYTVFNDLDEIIAGIPPSILRGQLRAKMNVLRDVFDQQERSHKEEMLTRVDRMQAEITKLSTQMAESQQMTAFQQMAESQQSDASFIEISDTDDDAVGRAKKKEKDKREKKTKTKTNMKTKTKGGNKAGRKRSRRQMEEDK